MKAPDYRILVGDVCEKLAEIPAGSIACVCTSPPFFGLRDYGIPPSAWPEVEYAPMTGLPPVTVPATTCCLGLEPDPLAYIGHLVLIWREVWRVMREDAVCWLNLGDSYSGYHGNSRVPDDEAPSNKPGYTENMRTSTANVCGLKPKDLLMIPSRAALALQADGWYLRSAIVWAKGISFCPSYSGSVMPESVTDRPTSAHEMIYLLAKRPAYFYDAEAVRERGATGDPRRPYTSKGAKQLDGREVWHSGERRDGDDFSSRNLRNVWAVSPKGNPLAHFATWPEDLVRPMVQAGSPEKCCAECGAPRERVVEREHVEAGRNGGPKTNELSQRRDGTGAGGYRTGITGTTGFRPTCAHDVGTVPPTVLDIFAGSGTTLRVALQLGRRAIGIEKNPEYAEMARQGCEGYHKPIPRPAVAESRQGSLFDIEEGAEVA